MLTSAEATAESRPARRPHAPPLLDSLTGLRGLAAILVFGFHFTTFQFVFGPTGGLEFAPLTRPRFLTMSGNFAVGSFFILSGFVLALTTREGTSLANFCAKRVGKLYPVYFVTTALAIGAIVVLGMPITAENIILHLTLLQSWVPFQEIYTGVNPVTWSLSTEAFFYLLFPLALFVVQRLTSRALYWVLGAAVFLEFALPLYVMHYFTVKTSGGHLEYFSTGSQGGDLVYWLTLPFPPYRFLEFLVGMVCCILLNRGVLPTIRQRWAWAWCAVAYVIGTYSDGPLQRTAVGFVALPFLVVALAQADLAGRWSLLRGKVFVGLGKLSYGMYAIQLLVVLPSEPFVMRWLSSLFGVPTSSLGEPAWKVLIMIAYFGLVILLSVPIYRYIEVPAYDFAKRLYRSRKGSPMFAAPESAGKPSL
ncbi:acyltransferase family protein [Streptomyces sp. NRRL B-1140]|uniref:acyltransferase family protein n=1 Tax=Streptomyces sp. NRRL B-1140 TaxID=1415549 RepID=UPI0003C9DD68|nr:acyltransferase [Streptomyces sp. NRRL B-1140]AGZ94338.1 putative transmembrane acyltransferase [Streptomyces sp. NRRL B-1140]